MPAVFVMLVVVEPELLFAHPCSLTSGSPGSISTRRRTNGIYRITMSNPELYISSEGTTCNSTGRYHATG
jgi:hypothetical protein